MGTQKAKTKVATSKLANPVVEESSLSSVALNGFSPSGEYFAIVHRPASSYILRVHDAATNALRSEYVVETGEISSLSWLTLPADGDSAPDSSSPSKKRKKRSNATPSSQSLIALGFADGSIELYSVEHSAVVKRFNSSENTPKSRIRAVRSRIAGKDAQIWTCSEDGQIRIWSISSLSCIHSWTPKSSSPFTTFEFRPDSQDASFIAGGSNVALYTPEIIPTSQSFSASQSQTFEGHSSPVKQLIWDLSTSPRKFISTAQTDRFLNIWEVPSPGSSNASGLLASVGLDAEVKHVATGSGHSPSERLLLATSATSKAAVFAVPSKKIGAGDALSPLVMFVSSTASVQSEILGGTFLESKAGYVRFARLIGGSKVSFTDVHYLDDDGKYKTEVRLEPASLGDSGGDGKPQGVPLRRYNEHTAVISGANGSAGGVLTETGLHIDPETAELTLGERLLTLHGPQATGVAHKSGKKKKNADDEDDAQNNVEAVPVNSLSRTLIQALHSSDSRLLESCLAYSQPSIIRNTVQLIPSQLAIPLISACVERLGRGRRGANMKGGGGGASAQRGTALLVWIKAVLVIHSGHLMAVPDLAARLSALHTVITNRLTLQNRLVSLSGRLDLVLAQMELRSSASTAGANNVPEKPHVARKVAQYVEGESSDETEEGAELDNEDDGSVEDVVLGGSDDDLSGDEGLDQSGEETGDSEDDSEDDSDLEEPDSDDEDSDASGPLQNGFIDDEAEEWSEEEDEEDSD